MRWTIGAVIIGIAGFFVGGLLSEIASPHLQVESGNSRLLGEMEGNASASVFGEFRSNLAGYLWMKIDEYIHGGVKLRPLTQKEKVRKNVRTASVAHGEEEGLRDEHSETSSIPEKERDFRGAFGDIERNTQPFFDIRGHKHHDPKEALPLFRFATWSDPHFVIGYVVGADTIARDNTQVHSAINYLKEGLRYNPQNISIRTELARYYCYRLGEYDAAMQYAQEAIQLGKNGKADTEDEQEGYLNAYRWLVLIYDAKGDKSTALKTASEGMAIFPEDPIFPKMIERLNN